MYKAIFFVKGKCLYNNKFVTLGAAMLYGTSHLDRDDVDMYWLDVEAPLGQWRHVRMSARCEPIPGFHALIGGGRHREQNDPM